MVNYNEYNPQYDDSKKEKTIYVSKRHEFKNPTTGNSTNVRYISQVLTDDNCIAYFKEKGSMVLRETPGGRQKIRATLYEGNNGVFSLHVARFSNKTGNPCETGQVCFCNEDIRQLYYFLTNICRIDYSNPNAFSIPNEPVSSSQNNQQITKLINSIPKEQLTDSVIELIKKINTNQDKLRLLEELNLNIEDLYNSQKLKQRQIIVEEMSYRLQHMEIYKEDKCDGNWQDWFGDKKWIFGSDVAVILDERRIDHKNIYDYIVKSYDGFVDLIEIKDPKLPFWSSQLDHNNLIPSADLVKAITQCANYIHSLELKANEKQTYQSIGDILKPRCTLVIGRSNDWDNKKFEAFRILNSMYHNINIITYDMLLERAKKTYLLDNDTQIEEKIPYDDCPF